MIPSNLNYLKIKFTALESNIPGDSKAVSTDLYEKVNSYIEIVIDVNNFENQTSDKKLKQIHLSEVMGNLQYSFSMGQLEKWEEVHPNRWANITKISIDLIYLFRCVLEKARRKLL